MDTELNLEMQKLISVIYGVVKGQTLKKIVFSKPTDDYNLKAEGRLIRLKGQTVLQIETFTSDGKAFHSNYSAEDINNGLIEHIVKYRQINVITVSGEAQYSVSKKGKASLLNKIKSTDAVYGVTDHDKQKTQSILYENTVYPFMVELSVTDENGKIFDRKRSKFRQIDKFLQYVDDIYPKLPSKGDLYVLDLCCGKSYLTFAVYWFLTEKKGRNVKMVGVDLKSDVIDYCSEVAKKLNYNGLSFICGDILKFVPEQRPSLVLSLHACDIATDIVLTTAAKLEAEVILSTPCCHQEVMREMKNDSTVGKALLPIMEHSLLKQKLAVAITDALRCKRLQASGYSVNVTELIDPEDTPKNLLIRAYKISMSENEKEKYKKEFLEMSSLCGVNIFPGKDSLK